MKIWILMLFLVSPDDSFIGTEQVSLFKEERACVNAGEQIKAEARKAGIRVVATCVAAIGVENK